MRSSTILLCLSLVVCPGPARAQPASSGEARAAVIEQLRRGDLEQAEATCRGWLAAHPGDSAIIHMLGVIQLSLAEKVAPRAAAAESRKNLLGEARELLERAEELSTSPLPDIDHALGFIYLAEGHPTRAKQRLDTAISLQPGRAKLYMLRGEAQLQLHLTSAAEADLRRAVELDPKLFQAQILHANALFRLGRVEEASERLERLFGSIESQSPDQRHWQILYDLSRYAGNDLERERAHLEKARAIAPDRALTRSKLGIVYYRLGDLPRAREELDVVLSLPEQERDALVDALHYRGLIAKHSGGLESARGYFERALALAPNRSESLKAYAAVLRQLGETEQADDVRERFGEIVVVENEVKRLSDRLLVQPRQPELRVDLIRLLIRLERHDEAAAELSRFKRQFPAHASIGELERTLSH